MRCQRKAHCRTREQRRLPRRAQAHQKPTVVVAPHVLPCDHCTQVEPIPIILVTVGSMQAALRAGRQLARLGTTAARGQQQARNMSSGHSIEESIGEMSKWR